MYNSILLWNFPSNGRSIAWKTVRMQRLRNVNTHHHIYSRGASSRLCLCLSAARVRVSIDGISFYITMNNWINWTMTASAASGQTNREWKLHICVISMSCNRIWPTRMMLGKITHSHSSHHSRIQWQMVARTRRIPNVLEAEHTVKWRVQTLSIYLFIIIIIINKRFPLGRSQATFHWYLLIFIRTKEREKKSKVYVSRVVSSNVYITRSFSNARARLLFVFILLWIDQQRNGRYTRRGTRLKAKMWDERTKERKREEKER